MRKALELAKLSKELNLKGSVRVRIKKGFQRQSMTKYLRVTLVFMSNSVLGQKLFDNS